LPQEQRELTPAEAKQVKGGGGMMGMLSGSAATRADETNQASSDAAGVSKKAIGDFSG